MQNLYSYKNIYSIYNDLFICDDTISDIQQHEYKKNKTWGWDLTKYVKINHINIKNIIVYGFKKDFNHTHNYIHKMYYSFFKYYFGQLNIYFYDEEDIDNNFIINNSIILCSPTHYKYKKYINGHNNYYIFHLDNYPDNIGYNTTEKFFSCNFFEKIKNNLDDYIILLCREKNTCSNLNYFESNLITKEICLPWFSSEKYIDLINIDINLLYDKQSNKTKQKYYIYFGSIWPDNIELIKQLIEICCHKKIYLLLSGRKFKLNNYDNNLIEKYKKCYNTYVLYKPFDFTTNDNNSFEYINNNYDIKCFLSLQGMNKDIYFSNRTIENISRGNICVTNSPVVKKYLSSAIYFDNTNMDSMFDYLENIFSNKDVYCNLLKNQINEVISKFYGYNIINNIFNFMKEINYENNKILTISSNVPFKLWLCSNDTYENNFFKSINSNDELLQVSMNPIDLIITNNNYSTFDKFLIQSILLNINCELLIDKNFEFYDEIINLCNKNNKNYKLKNKLNITCLISGQRTGSTLIIDYIQKLSHNILALSEIFNYYKNKEIYSKNYDIINKNGILYDTLLSKKFIKLNNNNLTEYYKQFEDYAIYLNKNIFIFKLTIDFKQDINDFSNIDNIINLIKDFKLIYLDRNELDSYTSKLNADKWGYSNVIYQNDVNINQVEFDFFIKNKNYFYSKYICNLPVINITYDYLTNNKIYNSIDKLLSYIIEQNCLDEHLHEIILQNTQNYFNIKQCQLKKVP